MLKAATLTKLIVERTCALSSPSHSIRGVNHQILQCYYFSDSSSWNKKQIDRIESKFKDKTEGKINNDEDLQQMWREMESRVVKRRPRTLRDTKGKTGRTNVRKTDEEMWLREGLYEKKSNKTPGDT